MKINREDIAILFFITIIGLFVRISPALSANFPLNDGGLFYKMILDLQENHFALPVFTTYNNAGLPFAYPPLAFYLYALISEISDISVLKLMQFLPAIISGLTIPAFFLLAKEILDTKREVLLSVLIFAFVPRAFEWLIMGGGITRSLGFLFALLAIRQCIILFSENSIQNLIKTIFLFTLVILTHPEATVHLVISSAVIYFWKSKTIEGFKQISIAWFASGLISSLWWLEIISKHGMDPFVAALTSSGQDSYNLLTRLIILFRFNFTDEPYLALSSVLGLIGIFAMLAKHKIALPIWFCLIQLIEPRGGSLYMMLPLSMFAGFALDQVLLPVFVKDNLSTNSSPFQLDLRASLIGFVFLYGLLSAFIVSNRIAQELTLTHTDIEALTWVKNNTPTGSQFIVITQGNPLNDSTSEWFPALTNQTSIATTFGQEWVNDGSFGEKTKIYKALQLCAKQDVTCLNKWEKEFNINYSYIYLRESQILMNPEQTLLNTALRNSNEYKIIYENVAITILSKTEQ